MKIKTILVILSTIVFTAVPVASCSDHNNQDTDETHQDLFIKYEGSPLLTGNPGSWDESALESPMVIEDNGTYYMYYHAIGQGDHYRIGLAYSSSPYGPYVRYGSEPVLDTDEGSWDGKGAANAHVIKEGNKYYMWYIGRDDSVGGWPWWNWQGWKHWRPWQQWRPWRAWEAETPWRVGLATADSPTGPWKKYEGNPVLELGKSGSWDSSTLYLASVLKVNDIYYMWYAGFNKEIEKDGQLGLSTSQSVEGPWIKYPGNPVLKKGDSCSWEAEQIGETAVFYYEGYFHALYSGYPEDNIRCASIGYAYSLDGINWVKSDSNPVASPGDIGAWDEGRISEPHVLIEGDTIYLYHTGTRYPKKGVEEALGLSFTKLSKLISMRLN